MSKEGYKIPLKGKIEGNMEELMQKFKEAKLRKISEQLLEQLKQKEYKEKK